MSEALKLLVSLIACFLAAAIGSVATSGALIQWYPSLVKPAFNPPNWIFGPVWTILYVLMAVSLFLVWRQGLHESAVQAAVILFAIQLGLNVLWSLLFFGLRSPLLGLIDILILLVAIAATIVVFYRVSPLASALLLPYLLWVGFATILNFSIWRLNS